MNFRVLIALLLLLSLSLCASELETCKVIRIIDGDTIEVIYRGEKEKVRLYGIDTPERGENGFEEATNFVKSNLLYNDVYIKFPDPDKKRDNFGRLLANIYMQNKSTDYISINQKLLDQKLAVIYYKNKKNIINERSHQDTNIRSAQEQYKLGLKYFAGNNGSFDYQEASMWFAKAANQGHSEAQYLLGYMYKNGKGVSKDYKEAIKWYNKAAEQGHEKAQNELCIIYNHSYDDFQDGIESVRWFDFVAEQGNASAKYNLGLRYELGDGVPKNCQESMKWFLKAAKDGHAGAQFRVADIYYFGDITPKNYQEAVKWYTKAANQRYGASSVMLGNMYKEGKGVPKDYIIAYAYFNIAALNSESAGIARDSLESKMSAEQIIQAQQLSNKLFSNMKK